MPTYRYRCDRCGEEFRQRRRLSDRDDPTDCPECGQSTTERPVTSVAASCSDSGGGGG